jgi:hypothetical protein
LQVVLREPGISTGHLGSNPTTKVLHVVAAVASSVFADLRVLVSALGVRAR